MKLKIILIIVMFFLFSNIVSAQLGCCVGKIIKGEYKGEYCYAVEKNECDTAISNENGEWLKGSDYYNNDRTCDLTTKYEYNDWCNNEVCCIDSNSGIGEVMPKIKCDDKKDHYNTNNPSCDGDVSEIKVCMYEGECIEKTSKGCEIVGGVFYGDYGIDENEKNEAACENDLKAGCIRKIASNNCRAGKSIDPMTSGEYYVNNQCTNINECVTCGERKNCRNEYWACENLVEIKKNNFGDIFIVNGCGNNYICNAIGRCEINDCDHEFEESWCKDISQPVAFPREKHFVMHCDMGHVGILKDCDEYRNSICVEKFKKDDAGNNMKYADCMPNLWSTCIGISKEECNDDSHKVYCELVGLECLPKYPPGFEFWLVDKASEIKNILGRDDRMCSITTTEAGCLRTGDCEGGSGVAEPKTEEVVEVIKTSVPTDCGYVCCYDNKVNSPIGYMGDIKKEENCNEDYLGFYLVQGLPQHCFPVNQNIVFYECSSDVKDIYCKKDGKVCKTV